MLDWANALDTLANIHSRQSKPQPDDKLLLHAIMVRRDKAYGTFPDHPEPRIDEGRSADFQVEEKWHASAEGGSVQLKLKSRAIMYVCTSTVGTGITTKG